MITAGDFKKGITIEWDGGVWNIVDFQHVKPGKGSAFVRTTLRNVMTGAKFERTFNPDESLETARIETKELEYSYNDGELYYFMDTETWEQTPLEADIVADAMQYMKEGMSATVRFYEGKAFSVDAPNFVTLLITECEPGVKGDTATGATKPAVLETGAKVKVPLFVNEGEYIRVDTRTGEYMDRVKN